MGVLVALFWVSVGLVVVATLGYPLFLAVSPVLVRRKRIIDEEAEPFVTLIIAAYNEEAVIGDKLENSLALDYPREKLEIVVASDGSTDGTDAIVSSYASKGVGLVRFPRMGKTRMQNEMATRAKGEVLVFSDANAMYDAQAIRKLVRNLADPQVAGVCGQLVYSVGGEGVGASEQLYWNYEKFMRLRESNLSSVVGANGSIYAIRKSDYVPLPEEAISDFLEPLALVRSGKRMVYEPEAISLEPSSTDYRAEFRRKLRILIRSIFGLLSMRDLLNPFEYGIFAVQLLMHKMLRFLLPIFMLVAGIALAVLAAADVGLYRPLFVVSVLLAVMLILVRFVADGRRGALARVSNLAYYFFMVNVALVAAWVSVLRGKNMKIWAPERPQA